MGKISKYICGMMGKLMPENDELMERLRRYCAERRGRQAEIARALGVTRQRLNDWMNNREHPSLERGLALLSYLRRHR